MDSRQLVHYETIASKIEVGIFLGFYNPDAKLLGNYVDCDTPIRTGCGNPEHTFMLRPSKFKSRGDWCIECKNICPKQAERKFRERVTAQGRKVVGEYRGRHVPVAIRCRFGHVQNQQPGSVARGSDCNYCFGNGCKERAYDMFVLTLRRLNYVLMEEYVDSQTPVNIMCPLGHICRPRPTEVVTRFRRCSGCFQNTLEKGLESLLTILTLRGEQLIGAYVGSDDKVEVRCVKGHSYFPRPTNVISRGDNCSVCKESLLEQAVRLVFEKHQIKYDPQYHDPLAPKLAFDFRFWYQDREYRLEVDGEQHFYEIPFFHRTPTAFAEGQARDRLKDRICWQQAIQLIRIPYTCLKDMEYYLMKALLDDAALVLWDAELYEPLYQGGTVTYSTTGTN